MTIVRIITPFNSMVYFCMPSLKMLYNFPKVPDKARYGAHLIVVGDFKFL